MDNILQALLSWQFVLFSLAIAAVTFVIRLIVEFCLDNPKIPTGKITKKDRLWTDLILPILPVILGGGVGHIATMYPFPEGLTSTSGRISFGLVAGLLSGLLYRVLKSVILSKDVQDIKEKVSGMVSGNTPSNPDAPM